MTFYKKILSYMVPWIVIGVALMVLFGWSINNVYLTRVFPAFTPMNPITAVCFFLLGMYLLASKAKLSKKTTVLTFVATTTVLLLVGGVMLLKYLFGVDLQIDRFLFASQLGINRMAPATAVNFFFLGVSLLCFRHLPWVGRTLALITSAVGLYSIAAYIYNVVGVYGNTFYNPMAIHTAALFVLCGLYLLGLEGTEGILNSSRFGFLTNWFQNLRVLHKFIIGFGTVILVVLFFYAYSLFSVNKISATYLSEERSTLAGQMALTIEVDTLKVRAAFLEYVGTGNPIYLDQINSSRKASATERDQLRQLASSPETLHFLSEYETNLTFLVALTNQITALVSEKADPASYADLLVQREDRIAESNVYLEGILQTEHDSHASIVDTEQKQVRIIEVNFIFLSLSVLFMILLLSIAITRSIISPVTRLKLQAERLIAGDFSARSHLQTNDEIGGLARVIDHMAETLGIRTHELQEAKAKDEAILSSIGDAVFAVDTNSNLILLNPVAEAMAGIQKEDALGKHYSTYLRFVNEDTDVEDSSFVRTALSGRKTNMENHTALVAKDGRKIAVSDSASPLMNEEGNTVGAVIVFRDVTKEREIDLAKNEFVSLASHQLRTPLTSIKWFTELLVDEDAGKLTTEQREYTHEIQAAMIRMNDLVASLLDVSRLELGTFIIEPVPTNIISILDSASREQAPTFTEKKQVFTFTHPDTLAEVLVDPKLLRIIVQNLLSNAHKYTPEGGTITLGLEHDKKTGYQITCSDTGYGIPLNQQDSVFKKLFRADNIRTLDVEGTGLGLYIIKTIVDTAGCSIRFISSPGKGTTFTISIPEKGMMSKGGTKKLSGSEA